MFSSIINRSSRTLARIELTDGGTAAQRQSSVCDIEKRSCAPTRPPLERAKGASGMKLFLAHNAVVVASPRPQRFQGLARTEWASLNRASDVRQEPEVAVSGPAPYACLERQGQIPNPNN